VLGSALGLDKFRTKLVWQQTGVPTPPFETVLRGDGLRGATEIVAKLGCRCS
jgi:D-alanine-D-alanine ligase